MDQCRVLSHARESSCILDACMPYGDVVGVGGQLWYEGC